MKSSINLHSTEHTQRLSGWYKRCRWNILSTSTRFFKYLGVNVNNENCMHNEIKLRPEANDRCYFAVLHVFKSELLSSKMRIRMIYTAYFRPAVLYSGRCGNKLNAFRRRILRKLCSPVYNIWHPGVEEEVKRAAETIVQKDIHSSIDKMSVKTEQTGHVWTIIQPAPWSRVA